ncbi:MAG: TonB-dependent receptor plug domain-containing protein, partial [Mucilaginibacter polytrichastri]|nr:TonB-dependent receptor plug domain-containing protein [Mucilaginibacter polytrichastri]
MKEFLTLVFLFSGLAAALGQTAGIRGMVYSGADRKPLAGATLRSAGSDVVVVTAADGSFSVPGRDSLLVKVSFVGYRTLSFRVAAGRENHVYLQPVEGMLEEVVVSNGYARIRGSRSTGAFVQLDSAMINRRVSPNLLERLENMTPGLVFNRGQGSSGAGDISIRGRNTLFANARPLIVVDNFPYEGDIGTINPNDVESISVLKDAAAAAIWGARAGNGVIVIVTRNGKRNQPMRISANANITAGARPDLFYQPRMATGDYIDLERELFGRGVYDVAEQSPDHKALSPVVDLLYQAKAGTLPAAEADARIDGYRGIDVRNDFQRFFYQRLLSQQYALNFSGGDSVQTYYVSAGVDRQRENLVRNGTDRLTLNARHQLAFFNRKIDLASAIFYTGSAQALNNPGTGGIGLFSGSGQSLYPYAALAGADGQPLAIAQDYREAFIRAAEQAGLQDWRYRPLQDLQLADNRSRLSDFRINTELGYAIFPGMRISLL